MTEIDTDKSVLRRSIALDGQVILDVGYGTGEMVHFISTFASRVVGLECNQAQLAIAQANEHNLNEEYCNGVGQDLPFEDGTFDVVTFFNSLHHIPTELMLDSLLEASRVTKAEGVVYVAEPIAEGTGFEIHAPIDDETVVRAAALKAIHRTSDHGLIHADEVFYDIAYHYPNFEAFEEEMVRIDSTRQTGFDVMRNKLQTTFTGLGVKEDLGFRFDQPMRVNILKKGN